MREYVTQGVRYYKWLSVNTTINAEAMLCLFIWASDWWKAVCLALYIPLSSCVVCLVCVVATLIRAEFLPYSLPVLTGDPFSPE